MESSCLFRAAAAVLPPARAGRSGFGRLPPVAFHGRDAAMLAGGRNACGYAGVRFHFQGVSRVGSVVRAISGSSTGSGGFEDEEEPQLDFVKLKSLDPLYWAFRPEPQADTPEGLKKLKEIAEGSVILTLDTFERLRFRPGVKRPRNASILFIYHTLRLVLASVSAREGGDSGDLAVLVVEMLDRLRREVSIACGAPLPRNGDRFLNYDSDAARLDSKVALMATVEMMFEVVKADLEAILSSA